MPRLKERDCTAKREESGRSRTANGSSNDSSMSLMLKELLRLNGGLFQSNSITTRYCMSIAHAMYGQCIYTKMGLLVNRKINLFQPRKRLMGNSGYLFRVSAAKGCRLPPVV